MDAWHVNVRLQRSFVCVNPPPEAGHQRLAAMQFGLFSIYIQMNVKYFSTEKKANPVNNNIQKIKKKEHPKKLNKTWKTESVIWVIPLGLISGWLPPTFNQTKQETSRATRWRTTPVRERAGDCSFHVQVSIACKCSDKAIEQTLTGGHLTLTGCSALC